MPIFTKMARQYRFVMLSQYRVLLPTKKVVKVTNVDITLQGIAMYYFSGFADVSHASVTRSRLLVRYMYLFDLIKYDFIPFLSSAMEI